MVRARKGNILVKSGLSSANATFLGWKGENRRIAPYLTWGVRDQVASLKVKIGMRFNRLSLLFPNPDSYISEDFGMISLHLILINALFQEGSFPIVW